MAIQFAEGLRPVLLMELVQLPVAVLAWAQGQVPAVMVPIAATWSFGLRNHYLPIAQREQQLAIARSWYHRRSARERLGYAPSRSWADWLSLFHLGSVVVPDWCHMCCCTKSSGSTLER